MPGRTGFDPRRFSLRYDAVIHQVPNHFALVFLDRDFDTGRITDDEPVEVGVIRYDFRRNTTPPFDVTLAPGSAVRPPSSSPSTLPFSAWPMPGSAAPASSAANAHDPLRMR